MKTTKHSKTKEMKGDIEKEVKDLINDSIKEIDPKIMEAIDLVIKLNQPKSQNFEIINTSHGSIR